MLAEKGTAGKVYLSRYKNRCSICGEEEIMSLAFSMASCRKCGAHFTSIVADPRDESHLHEEDWRVLYSLNERLQHALQTAGEQ